VRFLFSFAFRNQINFNWMLFEESEFLFFQRETTAAAGSHRSQNDVLDGQVTAVQCWTAHSRRSAR
jgi:hypothetical protein